MCSAGCTHQPLKAPDLEGLSVQGRLHPTHALSGAGSLNRPRGGLNQVPSAALSCLSGKACRSIACSYGANEGAIRVHCAVRVQRTDPHVDAERRENGWAGPSARE